jgi:hypothetical protein
MKKSIAIISLALLVLAAPLANAQSMIDKVFEKYSGQEGFTAVNFNKEMFQMFQQMSSGSDSSSVEFKKMVDQLTGLKVLVYHFDSIQIVKAVSIYNEFAGAYPASSFKELMTINEGRQSVKFMTKQDSKGTISELVMLMKDKNEVGVISLTGKIDLSTISQISKSMNIKGMENLQKMHDHEGH